MGFTEHRVGLATAYSSARRASETQHKKRDPKAGPRPRRDQGAQGQAKRTPTTTTENQKPKGNLDGSQQRRQGQGPHGTPYKSRSTTTYACVGLVSCSVWGTGGKVKERVTQELHRDPL